MPAFARNAAGVVAKAIIIVLAILLRRNNRYFVVQLAIFVNGNTSLAVTQGMSMELGSFGLSCEFAEFLS